MKKLNKQLQKKFNKWLELAKQLKRIRPTEMELRRDITDALLDGAGTVKVLADDSPVTIRRSFTYSLDKDVLESIWDDLTEQEQNVVKWSPGLDLRAYKALPSKARARLDEAVVTKLAAPVIKVD